MRNERLLRALIDIFGDNYEVRNNYRMDCINPDCDDDTGNLEVSLEKGIFHCWKCNYSGTIRKLFKDYMGWVPKIDDFVDPGSLKRIREPEPEKKQEVRLTSEILPEGFTPLWGDVSGFGVIGKMALKYICERVTTEELEAYRIGYCAVGKYKFRIVVPTFEDGKAVYFVARTFQNEEPRYRNPDRFETGQGKEDFVFNLDRARHQNQIVICEGVFDAIRVGVDGVAIFGTELSEIQYLKLMETKKTFVVCLDEDAFSKAKKIVKRLGDGAKGYTVKFVKIPGKDPGSMDRQVLRNLIDQAEILQ